LLGHVRRECKLGFHPIVRKEGTELDLTDPFLFIHHLERVCEDGLAISSIIYI